jgi:hypothetical protein
MRESTSDVLDESPGRRDELIEILFERCNGLSDEGSSEEITSVDALLDIAALLSSVSDPASDLEVLQACSMLQYARAALVRDEDYPAEFGPLVTYSCTVIVRDPDRIPPGIKALFTVPASEVAKHVTNQAIWEMCIDNISRYEPTDTAAYWDAIGSLLKRIAETQPSDTAEYSETLIRLADAYWQRYKNSTDLDHLLDCIKTTRMVIQHTDQAEEAYVKYQAHLGFLLSDHFEHTKELSSLTEAIMLWREAASLRPDKEADLSVDITVASITAANITGDANYLQRSLETAQAAILSSNERAEKAERLNHLAHLLLFKYQKVHADETILSEAHQVQTQAVALTTQGDPSMRSRIALLQRITQATRDQT